MQPGFGQKPNVFGGFPHGVLTDANTTVRKPTDSMVPKTPFYPRIKRAGDSLHVPLLIRMAFRGCLFADTFNSQNMLLTTSQNMLLTEH